MLAASYGLVVACALQEVNRKLKSRSNVRVCHVRNAGLDYFNFHRVPYDAASIAFRRRAADGAFKGCMGTIP